ncbi:hypothetical protein CYY_003211 [Polysphondylium violaceum]|uniref:Uncharacterized protein n=1 Tax=Polysphondylium violaceum TaxID=133409 RepID=A0A8J4PX44_9MYCE|nr:hypothetical protein CYY_003211 [Polysphondylium violaceum]
MKYILLLLAFTIGYINAQIINGYGNLSPSNSYVVDMTTYAKFSRAYRPQPQNMLAFGGLDTGASSYSLNAVYSNSANSITWGLVNYMNGGVSDLETANASSAYNTYQLNGISLVPAIDTLFYLGYQKSSAGQNQVDLITFKFGSQLTLPITVSRVAEGAYDYSSGSGYFVVSVTNSNHYQCFWVDVTTNQVVKNITINEFTPASIYKVFVYKQELYIVQPDSSGNYVEVYVVDWADQVANLVSRVLISIQPIEIQVSLTESYLAIFCVARNADTAIVPLISLSDFTVADSLEYLPVSAGNIFFIY